MKPRLSKLGLFFNEHIEGDGETAFRHAASQQGIDIWEVRSRVNMKDLPRRDVDDWSFVFSRSRPSGEWNDDDYDVLADVEIVGRIFKANAAPVGSPWTWTLAFGHHEGRTPTHGYAATREAAMSAFAKRWRRE